MNGTLLSISGTHNVASQFGTKVVQFAVKPVIEYGSKPVNL